MARAFLSIGSNIDPAENIRKAIELLCRQVSVTAISTVYFTEAEGRPEQPRYYNCVVEVETESAPVELKHAILRRIEEALGRRRTGDKYAPRTIDLDLIIYDDLVVEGDDLSLPAPQIWQRAFVALPLLELSPRFRLPGSGVPIEEIAASFSETLEPLSDYTASLRKGICHHEHGESKESD